MHVFKWQRAQVSFNKETYLQYNIFQWKPTAWLLYKTLNEKLNTIDSNLRQALNYTHLTRARHIQNLAVLNVFASA